MGFFFRFLFILMDTDAGVWEIFRYFRKTKRKPYGDEQTIAGADGDIHRHAALSGAGTELRPAMERSGNVSEERPA